MKAKYEKEANGTKVKVEVEFDEYTDEVAYLLSFLDFPIKTEIRVVNENDLFIQEDEVG